MRELTHHHEAEDELLWPFLQSRGVELSLLEQMEAEHVAMKTALADVSSSLESLVAAPTAANATAAADTVSRAEVVINGHLEHEERDVEAPLGDLENDADVVALLYRPAYYLKRELQAADPDAAVALAHKLEMAEHELEVIVAKNRNGEGEHTVRAFVDIGRSAVRSAARSR